MNTTCSNHDGYSKILGFLALCEFLTPISLPEVRKIEKLGGKTFRFDPSVALPWEHNSTGDVAYLVYLGICDLFDLYSWVGNKCGMNPSEYELDAFKGKNTYLARIKLDGHGRLIPSHVKKGDDSIEMTDQLLGMAYLLGNGKELNFNDINSSKFRESIRHSIGLPAYVDCDIDDLPGYQKSAIPLGKLDLIQLSQKIYKLMGINDVLKCKLRISIMKIGASSVNDRDIVGVINSFYINDLSYLQNNTEELTPLLKKYLGCPVLEKDRVDLLNNRHILRKFALTKKPAARWPSNPEYSLNLAQQAAVNLTANYLDIEHVVGVNGPPGTGKTTLLNDICASVAVSLAQEISEFSSPDKLFSRLDGKLNRLSIPIAAKYGTVVTSNNNIAVENVSNEQPLSSKISKVYFGNCNYFADSATLLLKQDCWGLAAATLGKKENKELFSNILPSSPDGTSKTLTDNIKAYLGGKKPLKEWKAEKERFLEMISSYQKRQASNVVTNVKHFWETIFGEYKVSEEDQLSSAGNSVDSNIERVKIYLSAMELRRLTILCNAEKFIFNIKMLDEFLNGAKEWGKADRYKYASDCWDTLFFLVPTVSTTLASFSNLFAWDGKIKSGMGGGSIGWLLIDESGQATPQSVIPALWRARKAIVIGDPLQIEPVVTGPKDLVNRVAKDYDLEDWDPFTESAQTVADRITKYGTWVETNGKKVWTGVPLRVHFRCNEPMFSISNSIAYCNQMVRGVPEKEVMHAIPPSVWIDVKSDVVEDAHVIPAEIDALDNLLKTINSSGYTGKVYVISPFRKVANRLVNEFSTRGWDKFGFVLKDNIGTVHTFQGKEAEIVIFVLGSDPKTEGARRWASGKPNLLNVAVTRSQLRFYAIGNKTLWDKLPFFREMAISI